MSYESIIYMSAYLLILQNDFVLKKLVNEIILPWVYIINTKGDIIIFWVKDWLWFSLVKLKYEYLVIRIAQFDYKIFHIGSISWKLEFKTVIIYP